MLITQTESGNFPGKMLIGKLMSGQISVGEKLQAVDQKGAITEMAKISRISKRYGTNLIEIEHAFAGDIISIAGFRNSTVGSTINNIGKNLVIPVLFNTIIDCTHKPSNDLN
jgi:GTP-binding protein